MHLHTLLVRCQCAAALALMCVSTPLPAAPVQARPVPRAYSRKCICCLARCRQASVCGIDMMRTTMQW